MKQVLLCLLISLVSPQLAASLVTFEFSGVFDRVTDNKSILPNDIGIGTEFKGFFTYNYDPSLKENKSFENDPTVAFYPVISNSFAEFGNLNIEGDTRFSSNTVQIWDDRLSGGRLMDLFWISPGLDYSPPFNLGIGNTLTASYTFSLWDYSADFIQGDILPKPEDIVLADFDRTSFSIFAMNHDEFNDYNSGKRTDWTYVRLEGGITSLRQVVAPVSEPSTIFIFILSICIFLRLRPCSQ
ncbi:hypothetical protein [Alteromonas sp. CYL-A6]|uniref:hypothetical protein n=1 Tax=Alteromonas nitratireducens TaxID=3390813 RepID=UPI0034B4440C